MSYRRGDRCSAEEGTPSLDGDLTAESIIGRRSPSVATRVTSPMNRGPCSAEFAAPIVMGIDGPAIRARRRHHYPKRFDYGSEAAAMSYPTEAAR